MFIRGRKSKDTLTNHFSPALSIPIFTDGVNLPLDFHVISTHVKREGDVILQVVRGKYQYQLYISSKGRCFHVYRG